MTRAATEDKSRTTEQRRDDRTSRRAAARKAQERFKRARIEERNYARQLSAVAREVGVIVRGFAPRGELLAPSELLQSLRAYSDLLRPWARAVATRMIMNVARRDERAWAQAGEDLARNLRREVLYAPTGAVMRALLEAQVQLITSLPTQAAQRVHRLSIEAVTETGTRAKQLADEIMRTEDVTKVRALLIARTETSRTATAMTQARAHFIGSTHFIWETSRDSDVREIHRKLQGKVFRWDDPPVAGEKGERALPGAIYNCRCWPSPVIPPDV